MLRLRKPPTGMAHSLALQAVLREALALPDEDVVRINEVACGAIGCRDVVTILLIMSPGRKTAVFRVDKPLAEVGLDDLLDAMLPPAVEPRAMLLADALAGLGIVADHGREDRR